MKIYRRTKVHKGGTVVSAPWTAAHEVWVYTGLSSVGETQSRWRWRFHYVSVDVSWGVWLDPGWSMNPLCLFDSDLCFNYGISQIFTMIPQPHECRNVSTWVQSVMLYLFQRWMLDLQGPPPPPPTITTQTDCQASHHSHRSRGSVWDTSRCVLWEAPMGEEASISPQFMADGFVGGWRGWVLLFSGPAQCPRSSWAHLWESAETGRLRGCADDVSQGFSLFFFSGCSCLFVSLPSFSCEIKMGFWVCRGHRSWCCSSLLTPWERKQFTDLSLLQHEAIHQLIMQRSLENHFLSDRKNRDNE